MDRSEKFAIFTAEMINDDLLHDEQKVFISTCAGGDGWAGDGTGWATEHRPLHGGRHGMAGYIAAVLDGANTV